MRASADAAIIADTQTVPISASRAPSRASIAAALVLVPVILVICRGLQLPCYLGRDPGAFCMQGLLVLHGQIPYRDFWEHKNAGLAYLLAGAFAIGGPSAISARLAELAVVLAACMALVGVERRLLRNRAIGLSGPLLALLWSVNVDAGLYTTFWSSSFGILALYAGLVAGSAAGGARLFLAGVAGLLLFLAFACRQTGLAIVPAIFLATWLGGRRGVWTIGLTAIAAFAACCALAFVALQQSGAWPSYVNDTIHFNVQKSLWLRETDPCRTRLWNLVAGAGQIYGWLAAGSLILAAGWMLAGRARGALCVAGVWLLMECVALAVSPGGYSHYVFAPLAPLALLVGAAFALTAPAAGWVASRPARAATLLIGLAACFLAVRWDWAPLQYGWAYYTGAAPRDQHENVLYAAAARVRALTEPGERVHVWSALPTLQFLSGTLPVTRYPQNLPLLEPRVTSDAALDELLIDLKHAAPRVVVVVEESLNDFASRGAQLPISHAAWLESNYCHLETITAPPAPLARYNHIRAHLYVRCDSAEDSTSQPAAKPLGNQP